MIDYNPLNVGTINATLEAVAEELGTYVYAFKLIGLPPVPEPAVYFTAALGEIISQRFVLKNDANEKVEFFTKVSIFFLQLLLCK